MLKQKRLQTIRTISLIILSLILGIHFVSAASYDYSEATLGIWGGKLSAGANKLNVPARALSEDTFLWMKVFSDGESRIDFEFGAHGTQFAVPVEIELSWSTLKDVTVADLILYYYDEAIGDWVEETMAVWNANKKKVTLSIDHFSLYYFDRR